MTRLDAAVAGDAARRDRGQEARRKQGGRAGDEPVQDDRDAGRRSRPMITPTSAPISSPPTAASTPTASSGSGAFLRQRRARRRRPCAASRRVVDAGAASRDALGRKPRHRRGDGARRGRVADAHLADPDERDAVALELIARRRARSGSTASASSRDIAGPAVMSSVPARIAEPDQPGRAGPDGTGCRRRRRRRPR